MLPFHWIYDYIMISRSGLFMRDAYARSYLGPKFPGSLALLHYVIIGEPKGYLPNPFFDPFYFSEESGCARFGAYLGQRSLWENAPSVRFDPRWYIARNSATIGLFQPNKAPFRVEKMRDIEPRERLSDTGEPESILAQNPLVHFWTYGMVRGTNPSARFDLTFFREAVCRDRPDKLFYAFALFANRDDDVPLNTTELKARQDRFYADIVMNVLREPTRPKSRYLVFVQAGRTFRAEFGKDHHGFDLMVNYYEPCAAPWCDADYVLQQRGTKTTAIRRILETRPDLLLGYDFVLLLDDDVAISGHDIDRLFETMSSYGLDLAQASLSPKSECFHQHLKQPQAGPGVTPLTTVEIMMPVISSRVLRRCGWVFGEGISGWGIDWLLGVKVREAFGNTIALIGDVVASHERQIDTVQGAFYVFLKAQGIEARIEAGDIITRFALDESCLALSRHSEPLMREHHLADTKGKDGIRH